MKRIAFQGSGYNISYIFRNLWVLVDHYYREFKYFIQRGLYGYSDSDWWGLDSYLCEWLPSALRKIGKGAGYPGYGKANTKEKWIAITEKMAKGFEAHYEIGDKVPREARLKELQLQEKEGMKLFATWFGHLWD